MEERTASAHAPDCVLHNGSSRSRSVEQRLAGAPSSWGVCEVPGWGRVLPVQQVLSEVGQGPLEMASLGSREYGDRVVPVHLEDVMLRSRARYGQAAARCWRRLAGGCSFGWARGDARTGKVPEAPDEHRYEGWLVLEQDTAITEAEPAVGSGPMLDHRRSIEFLHNSARSTQEVNP